MRHLSPALALSLVVLFTAGCAAHRIPGTEIRDTPDTRAVVATIDAYRKAAERRDASAVLALVSRRYYDKSGTPSPADDVDYEQLRKRLVQDYRSVTSLHLDIGVKDVEVRDDHASAYVFYDERYRIQTRSGEVAKEASDQQRMTFVREDGVWRFTSGL